jgi:hypothetical protein
MASRGCAPIQEDLAWLGLAELALWEGRHDEAAEEVAEGLRFCAARDPEGILPDVSSPWYPLALRLEAERAEQAAARQAAEEVAEARRRAAPILAALDRLAATSLPQAGYPLVAGYLLLAGAEQSRLEGRSEPKRC